MLFRSTLFKSSSYKANKSPPGKYLSIIFSCSSASNNKSRNCFLFSVIFSIFTIFLLFGSLSGFYFPLYRPELQLNVKAKRKQAVLKTSLSGSTIFNKCTMFFVATMRPIAFSLCVFVGALYLLCHSELVNRLFSILWECET